MRVSVKDEHQAVTATEMAANTADNGMRDQTLPSVRVASFLVTLEANRDLSSVPVKSLSLRPDPGWLACAREEILKTDVIAWPTIRTYLERNTRTQSWHASFPSVQFCHLLSRPPRLQVDASFSLPLLASSRPLSSQTNISGSQLQQISICDSKHWRRLPRIVSYRRSSHSTNHYILWHTVYLCQC